MKLILFAGLAITGIIFLNATYNNHTIQDGIMRIECSAPRCMEWVEISKMEHLRQKFMSKLRGGDFVNFVFCPEHKERMTFGRHNDGDPNTNPDLEVPGARQKEVPRGTLEDMPTPVMTEPLDDIPNPIHVVINGTNKSIMFDTLDYESVVELADKLPGYDYKITYRGKFNSGLLTMEEDVKIERNMVFNVTDPK